MKDPNKKRLPEEAHEEVLDAGQESNGQIVAQETKRGNPQTTPPLRKKRSEPGSVPSVVRREDLEIRVDDPVLHEVLLTGLTLPDPPPAFEVVSTVYGSSGAPGAEDPLGGGSWPVLDAAALHGPAGDLVRAIGPLVEPLEAGILIQLLVAMGNAIGSGPHFKVAGDRHSLALYCALVGGSSKARKGTSLGIVKAVMKKVAPEWSVERVCTGLSTGEGLVSAVRDPDPDHEDPGVLDKRLMVYESELASVLKRGRRDMNTLSPQLRTFWDSGFGQVMTRSQPLRATGAHVSLIGHITREELQSQLMAVEAFNGFANRFLWCAVRRTKNLSQDEALDLGFLDSMIDRLREAIRFGAGERMMPFTAPAGHRWNEMYSVLAEDLEGFVGAVTGRGEAQVRRLALCYAVLDCACEVDVVHLEAALAMWHYCEASAWYIWGDCIGDPVAERIWDVLRRHPLGMSRTEVVDLFHRKRPKDRIDKAMEVLMDRGLVILQRVPTAGRTRAVYLPLYCDLDGQGREGSKGTKAPPGGVEDCSLSSLSSVLPSEDGEDMGEVSACVAS